MSDKDIRGRYGRLFQDDEVTPSLDSWDRIAAALPSGKPVVWISRPYLWMAAATIIVGVGFYFSVIKSEKLIKNDGSIALKVESEKSVSVTPEVAKSNGGIKKQTEEVIDENVKNLANEGSNQEMANSTSSVKAKGQKLNIERSDLTEKEIYKSGKSLNNSISRNKEIAIASTYESTKKEQSNRLTTESSKNTIEANKQITNGKFSKKKSVKSADFGIKDNKGALNFLATKTGSKTKNLVANSDKATKDVANLVWNKKYKQFDKVANSNVVTGNEGSNPEVTKEIDEQSSILVAKEDVIIADSSQKEVPSLSKGVISDSVIQAKMDSAINSSKTALKTNDKVIAPANPYKFKLIMGAEYAYLSRMTTVSENDEVYLRFRNNEGLSQKNSVSGVLGIKAQPMKHLDFMILAEYQSITSVNNFSGDAGELLDKTYSLDAQGNTLVSPVLAQYDCRLSQKAQYGGLRIELGYLFGINKGLVVRCFGSSSRLLSSTAATEGKLIPSIVIPAFANQLNSLGGSIGYILPRGKHSLEMNLNYRLYGNLTASSSSFKQQIRTIGVGLKYQF